MPIHTDATSFVHFYYRRFVGAAEVFDKVLEFLHWFAVPANSMCCPNWLKLFSFCRAQLCILSS